MPPARWRSSNSSFSMGDLVPGAPSKKEAEDRRHEMISDACREHLAKSGFDVVDTEPFAAKAVTITCRPAATAPTTLRELGADYAFTGVVYKVSELILQHERSCPCAGTLSKPLTQRNGRPGAAKPTEIWRRAIDYLYRNVLSARLEKLKK